MQQLWECPECGVIVRVTEVLPPLVMDAEKVIERKLLTCRINGLSKIMRWFRLGLPFLRLGCWLADMELEVEESPGSVVQSEAGEVWYSHSSQKTWPGEGPATLKELEAELEYRKYCQMEENANRFADIQRWYVAETERLVLAHQEDGGEPPNEGARIEPWICDECGRHRTMLPYSEEAEAWPEIHVMIGSPTLRFCSEDCVIANARRTASALNRETAFARKKVAEMRQEEAVMRKGGGDEGAN